MRQLLLTVTMLALASCATPYQEMGYAGGVKAYRIDAHTFSVVSRGNGYTNGEMVALYAIRKAAEETIASGDEWFLLKGSQDASRRGTIVTPGSSTSHTNASATAVGNSAFGHATTHTYSSPATVHEYVKPGAVAVFETGRGPRPDGARDAREVLSYVVPQTGG